MDPLLLQDDFGKLVIEFDVFLLLLLHKDFDPDLKGVPKKNLLLSLLESSELLRWKFAFFKKGADVVDVNCVVPAAIIDDELLKNNY